MIALQRFPANPILVPNKGNRWEAQAVFNGSPVKEDNIYHLFYRAMSTQQLLYDRQLQLSSIGHAVSSDGIHFDNRTLFIKPEYDWEKFGCEDPRITKIDDVYYIFYTALANYPPTAEGITVGVALTRDLTKIEEKHHVTPFNAKAMALFPRKIKGKMIAIFTMHTDMPPARIGIARFDQAAEIWSKDYWESWVLHPEDQEVVLLRSPNDHVEIGSAPIETEYGWLLIYSYIRNYFSPNKVFGIEAVLLDTEDPRKVIGRMRQPLLVPQAEYELNGMVPNIVFPSGAIVIDEELFVYYSAADTSIALATCNLENLLSLLLPKEVIAPTLVRFEENPIIKPKSDHPWEGKATFNAAALYWGGNVHLLYRAMSHDNTSVFGYATSHDGYHISARSEGPVYTPREEFEMKTKPGNSGCEDPRISKIDDMLYVCYTAFNGKDHPRVALTAIALDNFLNNRWDFTKPILISPPDAPDKDACIFPEKIKDKYVFLHRLEPDIWIDYVDDLNLGNGRWIKGDILASPVIDSWDSSKVGIAGPPIKTNNGWLLIYHGISAHDNKYRLGAMLLGLHNPTHIIARSDNPILEPEVTYEKKGQVGNVVFSCGAVTIQDTLFVYYGGADNVLSVATLNISQLLKAFVRS